MILAFMLEMLTLAPQYSTFGKQTVRHNGVIKPCSLSYINNNNANEANDCSMTNISMFYNRISVSFPFFSAIFYFANWMLIAMSGATIVYCMIWKEEEAFDDINDEEDDDDERKALNSDIYLNN